MNPFDYYNEVPEVNEYVNKFSVQRGITIDEALEYRIVIEYIKYCIAK